MQSSTPPRFVWARNGVRRRRPRYVYFAYKDTPISQLKIGIAVDPRQRVHVLKCRLLFAVESPNARRLEHALHQEFADTRVHTTDREGWTEWFEVDDKLRRFCQSIVRLGYWPWDRGRILR